MTGIYDAAQAFINIQKYEYVFKLGRKKKPINLHISFPTDTFMHLTGIQHLKDVPKIAGYRKSSLFLRDIINNKITDNDLDKSHSPMKEIILQRISGLSKIEKLLDNDNTVFKFNDKLSRFEASRGEFIICGKITEGSAQLDLVKNAKNGKQENEQHMYCSSFRIESLDRIKKHPRWTVLERIKINALTKEIVVHWKRPSISNMRMITESVKASDICNFKSVILSKKDFNVQRSSKTNNYCITIPSNSKLTQYKNYSFWITKKNIIETDKAIVITYNPNAFLRLRHYDNKKKLLGEEYISNNDLDNFMKSLHSTKMEKEFSLIANSFIKQ